MLLATSASDKKFIRESALAALQVFSDSTSRLHCVPSLPCPAVPCRALPCPAVPLMTDLMNQPILSCARPASALTQWLWLLLLPHVLSHRPRRSLVSTAASRSGQIRSDKRWTVMHAIVTAGADRVRRARSAAAAGQRLRQEPKGLEQSCRVRRGDRPPDGTIVCLLQCCAAAATVAHLISSIHPPASTPAMLSIIVLARRGLLRGVIDWVLVLRIRFPPASSIRCTALTQLYAAQCTGSARDTVPTVEYTTVYPADRSIRWSRRTLDSLRSTPLCAALIVSTDIIAAC